MQEDTLLELRQVELESYGDISTLTHIYDFLMQLHKSGSYYLEALELLFDVVGCIWIWKWMIRNCKDDIEDFISAHEKVLASRLLAASEFKSLQIQFKQAVEVFGEEDSVFYIVAF